MIKCIDCTFFSTFDEFNNGACRKLEKNFKPDFSCSDGKLNDKTLIPHEKHLGHGSVLGKDYTDQIHMYMGLHDEWQKYNDGSGEYKDELYYTYDAHRLLELINLNFATLKSIEQKDSDSRYFFIMRRNY